MSLFSPVEKISNHQAAKVLEAYFFAINMRSEEIVSEIHGEMCSMPVPYSTAKNSLDTIRYTIKKMNDNLLETIIDLEKETEV